jgi:hypothetical protein
VFVSASHETAASFGVGDPCRRPDGLRPCRLRWRGQLLFASGWGKLEHVLATDATAAVADTVPEPVIDKRKRRNHDFDTDSYAESVSNMSSSRT